MVMVKAKVNEGVNNRILRPDFWMECMGGSWCALDRSLIKTNVN